MSQTYTPRRGSTKVVTMDKIQGNPDSAISEDQKHSRQRRRKDSKWEILTSLEPGTTYNIKPKKLEGYLAKRRKWPLKGWHKRYEQKFPMLLFKLKKGLP